MITYGRVAVACRDKAAAASIYEILTPYADQTPTAAITAAAPVSHYLGELATVLDQYQQAESHFADAAALERRAGAAYFTAETDLAWGRMLVAKGAPADVERARDRLAAAQSVAAEHGYRDIERDSTEFLARIE